MNPSAIHLLEKNPQNICWDSFSANPNAIHMIEKNLDRISWIFLAENPGVIHLFKQNPEKIHWYWLSRNPSIFEEDYQSLSKERSELLREELMEKTWHPKRFRHWCLDTDDEFHL